MRFLFAFLLVLASHMLSSQTWFVSGIVRGEDAAPLVGASVVADDRCSARTDANGFYVLRCDQRPLAMTVRYVGHFTQRTVLQPNAFTNQRAELDWVLDSQNPAIPEVTIAAKPMEAIVSENLNTHLFDFGFVGENLLLLIREKRRYWLRLMTEKGGILSQIELSGTPTLLHRSCTGNFHVIGDQFGWEIALHRDRLDTLPRYAKTYFTRYVQPCAQQMGEQYYFQSHGLLNQSVQYHVFSEGQKPVKIFEVKDQSGARYALGAVRDFFANKPIIFRTQAFSYSRYGSQLEAAMFGESEGNLSELESMLGFVCHECYDQIHRLSELEVIRRDSVYAPLLKIRDTLCLFDHVNGRLVRFGPQMAGMEVIPIRYFLENGWQKLLLVDEQSQRIYARFSRQGGMILKEISPYSGAVLRTLDVSIAPYLSKKFKMRNGMLYFIGQPNINQPNQQLYRVNIFYAG